MLNIKSYLEKISWVTTVFKKCKIAHNYKTPNLGPRMFICKGVYKDVKKLSEILDLKIPDEVVEAVATQNELFIKEILEEASEACTADKRKVVAIEDVRTVLKNRDLTIFQSIFENY